MKVPKSSIERAPQPEAFEPIIPKGGVKILSFSIEQVKAMLGLETVSCNNDI